MAKEDREAKRQIRRFRGYIILIIVLAIIGTVIYGLRSPRFDVATYEVEGNTYYNDEEIINMGDCTTGVNIFTGFKSSSIKKQLLKDPYMEKVRISRKLPSTVVIRITERKQTAAVVYGERFVVIDDEGIVLRMTSVDPRVTIIRGLSIKKMTLGEPLEVEETVLYRQSMEIIYAMLANDMYFRAIDISDAGVSAYVLDNLVVKGLSNNIVDALKNKDIQLVVQDLFGKGIERGTIKVTGENYVSFDPALD